MTLFFTLLLYAFINAVVTFGIYYLKWRIDFNISIDIYTERLANMWKTSKPWTIATKYFEWQFYITILLLPVAILIQWLIPTIIKMVG